MTSNREEGLAGIESRPHIFVGMPIGLSHENGLVTVVWEGVATDAEMETYFDDLATLFARVDRYALVYDLRRAQIPNSRQRRWLADRMRDEGPALRGGCVGIAFVIESAIVRAALTGVLWLQPMVVPHVVTASIEEGRRWCVRGLAGRGAA